MPKSNKDYLNLTFHFIERELQHSLGKFWEKIFLNLVLDKDAFDLCNNTLTLARVNYIISVDFGNKLVIYERLFLDLMIGLLYIICISKQTECPMNYTKDVSVFGNDAILDSFTTQFTVHLKSEISYYVRLSS